MANLKSWKRRLKDNVYNPEDYEEDPDHPNCPRCGSTMDFYGHDETGDFPLGEGYWECPSCGFKITENEL